MIAETQTTETQTTDVETAFGQVVKQMRERQRLSQEEFADRCGIHRTYVSQLERGLKSPTLRLLWQICTALDIAPSVFIAEVENHPAAPVSSPVAPVGRG